ncbi:hypothetical protein BB559_005176 [Furculomyces boomerangus]|uniref:CCHC-type domain-containing protein n=2 Tax=Harpellales TaxID=61421 RepID=A0A2T9YA79_9FUNG|nr:hypothetical protein BB559_005176 [Furculomyces boomerangus]PVZ98984.1 hypothetical protein BB558_005017 [Smittium angustum]
MESKEKGIEAFESLLKGRDEIVKRGACKKCGGIGHLTFECKNMIKLKTATTESGSRIGMPGPSLIELEKMRIQKQLMETREEFEKTKRKLLEISKEKRKSRKKSKKQTHLKSKDSGTDSDLDIHQTQYN